MIDPDGIHITYNENGVIDSKDYHFLYNNPTYILARINTFARVYELNLHKLPTLNNIGNTITEWENGNHNKTLLIAEPEIKVKFELNYTEPTPITRHVYVLDFTTTDKETEQKVMDTLADTIRTYKNNKKVLDINLSFDFEEKFKTIEEYENR